MMKRPLILVGIVMFIAFDACKEKEPRTKESGNRMEWWNDARFGMFIHWGVYSNYESWNVRQSAQIPLEDYSLLLDKFNPLRFDASEWVKMAKNAGMKYIIITSKHHDGFALFNSKWTDFDVMSTPFKRDIIKELALACEKENIRLGFYYSIMDWHHPDYLPRRSFELSTRPMEDADMDRYVEFMKNQLTELLTNYGESPAVLWFDGEWEDTWIHERGKDLYGFLRQMDSDVIINNRIDKGRTDNGGITSDRKFMGDFGTPEQQVPASELGEIAWESCITMNDNWSYNVNDNNWKSTTELVRTLIDIASKGGNMLLNVGPMGNGLFPEETVQRLDEIGQWMRTNGIAIYGTEQGRYQKLPWGRCTQRKGNGETILYFHVFDWPTDNKLIVPDFADAVINAYALGNPDDSLTVMNAEKTISIDLKEVTKSAFATVIAIEIASAKE